MQNSTVQWNSTEHTNKHNQVKPYGSASKNLPLATFNLEFPLSFSFKETIILYSDIKDYFYYLQNLCN